MMNTSFFDRIFKRTGDRLLPNKIIETFVDAICALIRCTYFKIKNEK